MEKFDEAKNWNKGSKNVNYYQEELEEAKKWKKIKKELPSYFSAKDMPWEISPQGKIKHVVHEKMNPVNKTVNAYIQEIAADSKSGKHRHMAEEIIYVLEGKGYDLHWDVKHKLAEDHYEWETDEEPQKFEWEKGDLVIIPVNTVHQHFNDDLENPARILCATATVFKYLNFGDIEQIEKAPNDN